MAEMQENPFASPESEPSARLEDVPDLHGRMPGSVMLALGCIGAFIALDAILLSGFLLTGEVGVAVVLLGTPLLIGLLVLAGLWRRNRLARQWGRVVGLLGSLLASLLALAGVAGVAYVIWGGFDDSEIVQAGMSRELFIGWMLLGLSFYILPAVFLWTSFFALGRLSARQYFRLICPECGYQKAKAVDFLFRKAKCKRCGFIW